MVSRSEVHEGAAATRAGGRDAEYILGASPAECERLQAQARAVGSRTRELLIQAGIEPNMRVLDVGCGTGDVALLAAQLVGPGGRVIGVDREVPMLEVARRRAAEQSLTWVEFVGGDFRELPPLSEPVDAVVGRLVLMYQADPVAAVRSLLRHVRTGGLVVFQEYDDSPPLETATEFPLHEQVRHWIWETIGRSGADVHTGERLTQIFLQAGLSRPERRDEVLSQPIVPLVRVLLPRMLQYAVATELEIELETLDARLEEERRRASGTCRGQLSFGAWARV